jgi:peptidoglycan-associated lipoprotein
MRTTLRTLALVAVAAIALGAAGCAKKATQAPPTPAPTPGGTTTPTPTPTPGGTTTPTTPTSGADPATVVRSLQTVFFALDSWALDDGARGALDANARVLRDNPGVSVTIEGHCDERGTVEYNLALGERRAESVRQYLVDAGIGQGRMAVVSFGKERPVADGSDEAAWARNRRAEFTAR